MDDERLQPPVTGPVEDAAAATADVVAPGGAVSVKGILLGSGPRFARDAFGPVLGFYLGFKFVGLVAGMVVAAVVALAAYAYERQRERPGVMARISLAIIALQVVIGLIADDAKGFLAPPVLINGAYGLAFLASVAIGRPLAGIFAAEMHSFEPEVRGSATFHTVFSRVSLVWGAYLVVRAIARFWVLLHSGVDAFVLFNLVTGFPLMSMLMSWSVWYGVRSFRRSDEWGWAFEPPVETAPPVATEPPTGA